MYPLFIFYLFFQLHHIRKQREEQEKEDKLITYKTNTIDKAKHETRINT